MLFIGICGASGSGKTTLSRELVKALNNANCLEINQDAYYLDHPNLTLEERGKLNFTMHERNDQQTLLNPPDVLIVEGIHAFYDQRLLDHMY